MQKRSQKIQNIQDKKRNMLEESVDAEEEMRKVCEEIIQKEERLLLLSKKVDNQSDGNSGMGRRASGLAGLGGKKRQQRLPNR